MRTALTLRKSHEFTEVRRHGRRVNDSLLSLGAVESGELTTRFGLVVSKRVGGAVTRNGVKRRLRECISSLEFAPGYNIVVSARPATAGASYYMLMSSLKRLARQTGLLEPETLKSTELNDKGMLVENASENDVFERDTT